MNDYYKTCKFAKPSQKKKKRAKVSNDTYQRVYEACKGKCVLCGATDIQAHHIRYRSERRDLIDEPTNLIMLCTKHHLEVHSNKRYWQPILLQMSKRLYEEK